MLDSGGRRIEPGYIDNTWTDSATRCFQVVFGLVIEEVVPSP